MFRIKDKFSAFYTTLILCFLIAFTACESSENEDTVDEAEQAFETAQDAETAETQFYAVYNTALDALDGAYDGSRGGRTQNCATVSNNESTKTLTVDFGTNCVGPDGRTRSGIMIIGYRDRDRSTRDGINITFQNYSVDNYAISGTLSTTGVARNADEEWEYNLSLDNGMVSFEDKTINLSFDRVYTWTKGIASFDFTDDEFDITGTASGTTSNGIAFTSTITTPLLKKSICLVQQIVYPVSGIVNIEFSGSSSGRVIPSATLDYGTDACDKEVTLTSGSQTRVITLP